MRTPLIDCTLCSLEAERVSKNIFFDSEPVAEEIDEPPSIQIEMIRQITRYHLRIYKAQSHYKSASGDS